MVSSNTVNAVWRFRLQERQDTVGVLPTPSAFGNPQGGVGMNFYECLGLPPTAGHNEIEAAFAEWHRKFAADMTAGGRIDLPAGQQICNAYRALSQPEYRRKYDALLIWLESPPVDGEISDEEFASWLRPGTTIADEMRERLAAEQKAARGLRRIVSAKLARLVSCRGAWVGITSWVFVWVSGAAMFVTAFRLLHWVVAFATKLPR